MHKNPTLARLRVSIALNLAASRGSPIDVEQAKRHLEPAVLEIEAYANEQLDELQARIDDLERQLSMKDQEYAALDKLHRRSQDEAAVAAVAISRSPLENPWGFYVYYLWGDDGLLLYVGKSTNLLSRLGQHVADKAKRRGIAHITVTEYLNEPVMIRAEARAIRALRPQWNIQGVRDDDAA
jgi:predicted GIY-YIG superfamily endonuclease